MAGSLIKIFASATTTTTGSVNTTPTVTKYFLVGGLTAGMITNGGSTATIAAADLVDDTDTPVVTLVSDPGANGYINVYVNAVLQEKGISTYDAVAGTITLAVTAPDVFTAGEPVVIEVVSLTTTNTLVYDTEISF